MPQPTVVTEIANYLTPEWSGANESGWLPTGDLVLVLPDQASEKLIEVTRDDGSVGTLVAPQTTTARHSLAAESGILIAVGGGAFMWSADRYRAFEGAKPQPGQRVAFKRYSGQTIVGDDGKTYRYMTDNCIGMVRA